MISEMHCCCDCINRLVFPLVMIALVGNLFVKKEEKK